MCSEPLALLRLRVSADADPSAIPSVLGRFRDLNVVPRRVLAELGSNDVLHIEVDVFGLSEAQISLVASKLGECPCVRDSHWHRL